jgi:hypothetical protein
VKYPEGFNTSKRDTNAILTLDEIAGMLAEPSRGNHFFLGLRTPETENAPGLRLQVKKSFKQLATDLLFVVFHATNEFPTVNHTGNCAVTHIGDHLEGNDKLEEDVDFVETKRLCRR